MGRLVYILILFIGLGVAMAAQVKYRSDLATALDRYRVESHDQAVRVAGDVEHVFRQIYEGLRTIARLPSVRTIERYADGMEFRGGGSGFHDHARQAVQEICNSLATSVAMSEVYIVPLDLEPDEIDPHTGQLQTPITTFDELIIGRNAEGGRDAQHDGAPELEEIEIYEYRLMKKQLAWLGQVAPREDDVVGLTFPAISGPEVVTCDNSRYWPSRPDDRDRSGLVYAVPFYGLDGALKGSIVGVILTHALRDLLPSGNYAVRNPGHDYLVDPHQDGQWQASPRFVADAVPDPDLLYSEALSLIIVDSGDPWILWAGQPDEMYWQRNDVRSAHQFLAFSRAGAGCLTAALWLAALLVRRNRRLVEGKNRQLEDRVREQTAALSETESRIRAIVETAADGIITIDEGGVITTFNRAAEKMFGYSASEMIDQNVATLAPSPHRNQHDKDLRRYLKTGQSRIIGFEREVEGVRKDGSTFPIALRATEMIHGGQRSFIGVVQDITERKRLQDALESLARFPAEDPNAIIRVDNDACIIYANSASSHILAAWESSPGNHLPAPWPETIAQVLASGQSNTVEVKYGDRIYTIVMVPFVQAGYVNLFGKDITERVEAEVELRRSEHELRETTKELERQKAQLVDEVAQRLGAEAQARHDAMHDSLTGLSNRAVLLDRIERSLHRTKFEPGYVFALLFLDFDRFKIVNDSLGHEVGDQLLISIADRLQENLRAGDTASRVNQEPDPVNGSLSVRLGGDEFVILLDEIKNVADATLVAERLQQSLEAPHKIGSHEVTSTASIGIVTSDLEYDSADEMLRDADTAMYRAKATGRARHQVFDRAMHDEAVVRLELESDLRHALQHEQFRLVYQPIIDLRTGLAVGFEALIRWDHPERGVISPLDFIPVAEETGLIVVIGGWVLLEACQQLKQWQEQLPSNPPLCMNVNISKRQLSQPDLVKTLQNVLTTTRIEPHTLKLEITETAIMDNLDEFNPVLQRIRACGVYLCIDDFGTGHSSLSCLHEFSIDILKIDRSFLMNMKEERAYAAVTQAIVTLAQNLGMDVVAEGVETPQQVAQLQALEADYAQGYYFAKPLRPEDAAAFLQNQRPLAKSA